jgi:15-cis-phytoene synthase
MDNNAITKKSADHCRRIQKKFGKSYYFATLFLPKEKKQATQVLYAFFRMPDEIVDNPSCHDASGTKQALFKWKDKWERAYKSGSCDDAVLDSSAKIFKKYSIPYSYSEAFLDAMIMDTEKTRYKNYNELKEYMYGSAAVVGLMMSHVIGFSENKALEHAEMLGYAMQLTNFVRDIREDFELRQRIYLPRDEMEKFGVTEDDIKNHRVPVDFKELMKFEIARARELYSEAEKGLPMLSKDGRFAVKMASRLYSAILDKIEKQEYDIFSERAHTNIAEKFLLLAKEALKR